MPRLKIDLPQKYIFETEIEIRITDLNYGGHLGNDVFLSIIHEARVRFLKKLGYSEKDIEGVSIIMGDAAIVYKSEVFHGDVLNVQIALDDLSRMSCDLKYLLINKTTGKEAARAKTGIVFFDYQSRNITDMPEKFRTLIETLNK